MSQQKMVLQPLLRVWLGLFSGLLLVSAISAFHGEYWYFGDKQALYAAKAGEVSVHELYTPAKILFAVIVSRSRRCSGCCWLTVGRRGR
jgi:hypothetical protein